MNRLVTIKKKYFRNCKGSVIRKVAASALMCALLLFPSGCSARSAVTPETFQSAAESAGFTVTQEEAQQGTEAYYTASKDDIDVSYVEYGSSADAQGAYATMKKSIGSEGASVVVESDSYCKYTVTNGEMYHVLIRSGATLVYGKTPASGQSSLDQLVSDLDY